MCKNQSMTYLKKNMKYISKNIKYLKTEFLSRE